MSCSRSLIALVFSSASTLALAADLTLLVEPQNVELRLSKPLGLTSSVIASHNDTTVALPTGQTVIYKLADRSADPNKLTPTYALISIQPAGESKTLSKVSCKNDGQASDAPSVEINVGKQTTKCLPKGPSVSLTGTSESDDVAILVEPTITDAKAAN